MEIEEVLKAASPRPWGISSSECYPLQFDMAVLEIGSESSALWSAYCRDRSDAELIVTAVNAYERQREALLRVIDSPREPDKWLNEVYAATGIERATTLREQQLRTPVSTIERQREVIAELTEALSRARLLVPLVSVGAAINAGDDIIKAAGLNPWCMNEGTADAADKLDAWWINAALAHAQELLTPGKQEVGK